MARHHATVNGNVPFTPEEETERDAQEAAKIAAKPLMDWKASMQRADNDLMPRFAEDILDGMADKSGVAQITLDRLQAKKDKRGERP